MRFVPCEECPLRHKLRFKSFTVPELEFVRSLKIAHISVPARQVIVAPDAYDGRVFTLFSGWAFRYQMTPDGQRQIVDVVLPGSLIGLQQFMLGSTSTGVQSLTPVTLCVLEGPRIGEIFTNHSVLSEAMVLSLMEDELRIDVRLALIGRRTGSERLAYFLLELFERLQALEMVDRDWCYFPLQRSHLADLLGFSSTHISRSISDLKRRNLATIGSSALSIVDRAGMQKYSGYEDRLLKNARLLI